MSIYTNISLVRDIIDLNSERRVEEAIISTYNLCLKSAIKADKAHDERVELVRLNAESYRVLCNKKVVLTLIAQKVNFTKLAQDGKGCDAVIKAYEKLVGRGMTRFKAAENLYNLLIRQLSEVTGTEFKPLEDLKFVDVSNALGNFKSRIEPKPVEDTEVEKNNQLPDCWTKELLETYNSISVKDRELCEDITLPEAFRECAQHFFNINYSDEIEMSKELDNKFIEILGTSAMNKIIDNDSLAIRLAIEDVREMIKTNIGERIPLRLASDTVSKLAEHRELDKLLRKIFAINQEGVNAQKNGIKTLITLSYSPMAEYEAHITGFNK